MSVLSRLAWSWARRSFGRDHVSNIPTRALRHGEEAIEVMQAAAVPKETALKCVETVYSRPVGDLKQEIGGSLLTLNILCEELRYESDYLFEVELARVLGKSTEHFADRNQQKINLGLDVPAAECVPSNWPAPGSSVLKGVEPVRVTGNDLTRMAQMLAAEPPMTDESKGAPRTQADRAKLADEIDASLREIEKKLALLGYDAYASSATPGQTRMQVAVIAPNNTSFLPGLPGITGRPLKNNWSAADPDLR